MNKIWVLCEKDRRMLQDFSRLSLDRVRVNSLLSAVFSFLSAYLDANVKKEADKDRLVIEETAQFFDSERPLCELDLENIFEQTKKIDKDFLDRLLIPSFSITVHYSDFADIRIKRIWRIARTVYDLLEKWPDTASLPDAVRNAYTKNKFTEIVTEILHLYSLETRMLASAIRSPFSAALEAWAGSLFEAMECTQKDLASSYASAVFGDATAYA